jgi:DNA-binding CsgD family transcriptional regulator
MLQGKQVIIISSNCLITSGLRCILYDFFSPGNISSFVSFNDYVKNYTDIAFDFIFIHSEDYVLYNEHFFRLRNRVVVLTENDISGITDNSGLSYIDVKMEQSDVIEKLISIFSQRIKNRVSDNSEELTHRELDVLKLVAIGAMNKQIADKLSISVSTVISHRKNITRKLGINTVSGLTIYALINGIINSDTIESSLV